MKRKKQIDESKRLIFEGFMRLLKKKDYEDITISEIAEEAGVVRMTLYRHFKEKEDIILFGFEQNLARALKLIEQIENPSIVDLLVFRFTTLQHSPYTSLLAKHNRLSKLFGTIGKGFLHHFSDFIPEIKDLYDKVFIAGGIDAMTELWIERGMLESPEYMANKCLKLFELFTVSS